MDLSVASRVTLGLLVASLTNAHFYQVAECLFLSLPPLGTLLPQSFPHFLIMSLLVLHGILKVLSSSLCTNPVGTFQEVCPRLVLITLSFDMFSSNHLVCSLASSGAFQEHVFLLRSGYMTSDGN